MNSVELLAPAGGLQSAKTALLAGANAVYLGLKEFSAREAAENFSVEELSEIARFAHVLGARVYVCLNTLVKDSETEKFFTLAAGAYNAGADAILVQDIFLGKALKEAYPQIELHLSTQAGCCNVYGAQLAKDYGFSRVVLARETPISDIAKISNIIETEAFVQGALCSSFSGQCYFSSFAGNNSGNRGRCKQPCRKRYAVDRAGCEEYAYALSTSDLCLGRDVQKLLDAGVKSLKIEGRLRREEYVSAAVCYYRSILLGAADGEAFSRLRRAYNRGDYTRGLGFGQGADFLSRKVQGHIGERVGEIALFRGKYFCKSDYAAESGDGFKVLRGGCEVGGAVFQGRGAGGFFVSSNEKLLPCDEVRVTTCVSDSQAVLTPVLREMKIDVRVAAGEFPLATCGAFSYAGSVRAETAQHAPLTQDDVVSCFEKTDGLPVSVSVTAHTENAFLPKSALNAFRREFYEKFVESLSPAREQLSPVTWNAAGGETTEQTLVAAIAGDGASVPCDIAIYKPSDYKNLNPPKGAKKTYLYLPPLFTGADEAIIAPKFSLFDGIYCEGSYGVLLAKKYHVSLFAGLGFNLTNRTSAQGVRAAGAEYYAVSAELSLPEQNELSFTGAFALTAGSVKLMELCYCPFSRTCNTCDKRNTYTMTDEAGRKFPLRRYRAAEGCRFEVYNCVPLACGKGACSVLADCTFENALAYAVSTEDAPKGATRGHANRSML